MRISKLESLIIHRQRKEISIRPQSSFLIQDYGENRDTRFSPQNEKCQRPSPIA